MFILKSDSTDLRFPPVDLASPEGLLAVGGDLCAERLLEAYRHGIFPWYNPDQPILWWSPDPRVVLFPPKLHISRSLHKTLRQNKFAVKLDTEFSRVIQGCAQPRTQGSGGTWITPEMIEAYCVLHEQGLAHSVECWRDEKLVGGLYGVALGGAFFGESMFSRETDASKVAFVYLVRQLQRWGYAIIDCQLPSEHLFSLGAEAIRRHDFMVQLEKALKQPDHQGRWRFDPDLDILNRQG